MQTHKEEKGNQSSGAKGSSSSRTMPAGKFWCKICGAEYARVFALRLHMKSAHGLTEDTDLPQEEPPVTEGPHMSETEDSETAVLIAAAEADAAYISAVVNDVDVDGSVPSYQEGVEVGTLNKFGQYLLLFEYFMGGNVSKTSSILFRYSLPLTSIISEVIDIIS